MALSNAERQKRFREQLKKRARDECVTPEMVVQVARLSYEEVRKGDDALPPFEERLAFYRSAKGRQHWRELLPNKWDDGDEEIWGENSDLVRKVAEVMGAASVPPTE